MCEGSRKTTCCIETLNKFDFLWAKEYIAGKL